MPTSALVGLRYKDGFAVAIPVLYDGNPDAMRTVLECYPLAKHVAALLREGPAFRLAPQLAPRKGSPHSAGHPQPDACVFFWRDMQEQRPVLLLSPTVEAAKLVNASYVYLLEESGWTYGPVIGDTLRLEPFDTKGYYGWPE